MIFIIFAGSVENVNDIYKKLSNMFSLKDLGTVSSYFGLGLKQMKTTRVFYSSKKKTESHFLRLRIAGSKNQQKLLQKQEFQVLTALSPPHSDNIQAIIQESYWISMYLSATSLPDIASALGIVTRRVENPTQSDWNAIKRIMRYLEGTKYW